MYTHVLTPLPGLHMQMLKCNVAPGRFYDLLMRKPPDMEE